MNIRNLRILGLGGVAAAALLAMSAQAATDTQSYQSSVKVEARHHGREGNEALAYAGLAKIDAAQAVAAAQRSVPGKVLHAGLDNENGNLVYSVEIQPSQA